MPLVNRTFDQLIDFTRTSAATFVNSSGNIASTPQSRNLLTFTQEFANAAWSKSAVGITANSTAAPDGTMTADTCTPDTTSAAHLFFQSATVAGSNVQSIYVKANGYTKVGLRESQTGAYYAAFDLANGTVLTTSSATATITAVGNGWYRLAMVGTLTGTTRMSLYILDPTYTTGLLTGSWTPNGTSGVFIWGAQLEQASAATDYTRNFGGLFPPRFDYDPVTRAPRGLLIEEQRTNLFTNSEFPNGVSDAPTRGGNVSATTFSLVPGNTGLAINNTGPVTSFAYKTNFTTVVSTTYTFSAFVRMDDGNAPSFGSSSTTSSLNSFVLVLANSGVDPTTYTVTPMGGGFYRVSATATAASASTNNGVLKNATNDSRSFTVSGYQLEAGAFATSYIPTVASQVTRTADVAAINAPNFASWYNQSEGTIFVEAVTFKPTSVGVTVLAVDVSDGGINNRHLIGPLSNLVTGRTVVGGVTQVDINTAYTANATEKLAYAYKINDFAFFRNGSQVGTDTSGTIPTVDRMFIGNAAGSAAFWNGWLRAIRYYPTRLTQAQGQALTA